MKLNKFHLIVGVCATVLPLHATSEAIDFNRDIRPILSNNCYQCHGPDASARKAKLRLDLREAAFAERDGQALIAPGDPAASALFQRISTGDVDERMPPADSGKSLTPEQIAVLHAWIAEGAAWPKHWAFVAPLRPPLPEVKNPGWTRNPIDTFVLARLEREGLSPSPEADPATLLRRLSLDLTGLPPALAELDRLPAEGDDAWYGGVVEAQLESPHYGERWARHWLDAAQFADSDGFEKDKPRPMHAWRDWVITAFNEDMPYDRFVVEQIAGDLLPDATQDQRVATGFLRNSMLNEEGGIDPEQFRMEAMFNRMDVIGRAVLGLTVQCAQCHSHKYDPLTQTEYYRMMAFLNNTHEACITVYSPKERKQRDQLLELIAEVEGGIKDAHPDWPERMASWEAIVREAPEPAWQVLDFTFDDSSAGGQKCLPQGDGSYLAQGYAPTKFQPKMVSDIHLPRLTAVRLELLPDPNLPRGGPGRSVYGACALSEFDIRFAPAAMPIDNFDNWTKIEIASAIADVNPPVRTLGAEFPSKDEVKRLTGPIEFAIDGKVETAWTTDIDPGRRNQARYAIFKLAEPLEVPPGSQIAVRPGQMHGGWNSDDNQTNNMGRFRISVTDAVDLPEAAIPEKVKDWVAKDRQESLSHEVFSYWRTTVPEWAEANARIDALWQAQPQGDTQFTLAEREVSRETHRLERGDFLHPAETVNPGTPAFLNPLDAGESSNRLDFAHWLVSPDAPTTARTIVNRVWQHYFGVGLSATSSDFGVQGEAPIHPELLDWLAVEFMESTWSLKHLHRLIVDSATYRQVSRVSPALLEKDPANLLLARGARFRVEGEIVRDLALAASGLLNPAIGGPSVYPPAPEFLFQPPASYGPKIWRTEHGPKRYRRALYTFRFRSVPYPVLQTFDTPAGDAPCTRRPKSNTPLQALTTLNEPLFFECARALAAKTLEEGGASDEARLDYAFRCCVARSPKASETETLLSFLRKQRARIGAGELDPTAILAQGDGFVLAKEAANSTDLAAWTLAARVLLNLDESIMRQ